MKNKKIKNLEDRFVKNLSCAYDTYGLVNGSINEMPSNMVKNLSCVYENPISKYENTKKY